MIPLKDDNPIRTFPLVTIFLILANVVVFVYQWKLGPTGAQAFVYRMGAVPWEITHFQEFTEFPVPFRSDIPNVLTLLTSIFIHGGLFHLLGNMLYLWVFGDNVETLMGPLRFLVFYLLAGVAAGLSHVVIEPNSTVPMVGASGAISAVLGAYIVRFPRARVHMLVFLFIFIRVIRIPSLIALGLWFGLQVINGLGALGGGERGGGVAWFAHIGGFVAGMILVFLFEKKDRVRMMKRTVW